MLLYYIRHGQPIYDPDSLTPLGRRQAESVAHRLCQFGVDRIFASTSNRAIETAQPTCDILRLEPILLDWMNEATVWRDMHVVQANGTHSWCYVDPTILERFLSDEVRALGDRWYTHPAFVKWPFERGVQCMREAAFPWLASLGYEYDPKRRLFRPTHPTDERIALFAHEGAGLLFLSTILDIPYPLMTAHFTMGHTGVTVIEFQEQGGFVSPCVLQLSNDSHLYRDGLPTYYRNRLRF